MSYAEAGNNSVSKQVPARDRLQQLLEITERLVSKASELEYRLGISRPEPTSPSSEVNSTLDQLINALYLRIENLDNKIGRSVDAV